MTDSPKTDPEIDHELDALAAIIKRAERDLVDDKLLTIGGLPERTQAVCLRVAELPVENGRQYENRLNALIAELDALGRNITRQQDELIERLAEMDDSQPEKNEPSESGNS